VQEVRLAYVLESPRSEEAVECVREALRVRG
jgi:hypothetical protein